MSELDMQATDTFDKIHAELSKVIVGQNQVVEQIIICLATRSHGLLTGVPGLAKTLLVHSVSKLFDLDFKRIQFTPDLMPADIMGSEILNENEHGQKEMKFIKGPIFSNIVLAVEINRTPPKTQSALLEAMQEKQVSAGGKSRALPAPFYVFATQNPLEMEGTYPLPEAQLDRFMFNILIDYLDTEDEMDVVRKTTTKQNTELESILSAEHLNQLYEWVLEIPVAEEVLRYVVELIKSSRPHQETSSQFVNQNITFGAGTRAAQNLILSSKARALLQGRAHVSLEDIDMLIKPVLRHRIGLSYKAQAEGLNADSCIEHLLQKMPRP
jgi:MoxR-like ATPase